MTDIDDKLYSVRDVLSALSGYESEEVWKFASDLSRLSEDYLNELMDEINEEEVAVSRLKVTGYPSSPLCLGVYNEKDGTRYTTYLGEKLSSGTLMPIYCAYLDVNNIPGVVEMFVNAGLAEPYTADGTPVVKKSGFVVYPLYRFKAERLREIDPEGTKAYEDAYGNRIKQLKGMYGCHQNS